MKHNYNRTFALVLTMVIGLWANSLMAQNNSLNQCGLLGNGSNNEEYFGLFGRGGVSLFDGFGLQNFGEDENDLTLQTFGEEVALNPGILIFVASGIGYGALRIKKKSRIK